MPQLSAQAVAEKYVRNLTNSIPSIKAGVQAVTESPMMKAAARADAYVAGVQRAKDEQRYQEGLMSVSLEEWKRLTGEKGTARIASGAAEAKTKMVDFFSQLLPFTAATSERIQSMPKGTDQDSVNRMMANYEAMKSFRFRKRR